MSYTVEYYDSLITSEHLNSPKFVATVEAITSPLVSVQETLETIISEFDIDSAVGVQLDIVGQWIGLSRYLTEEITGVYYSVNGTEDEGVDFGVLKGVFDPDTGIIALPDDIYRIFLKIKIAANHWDGSIPGAYAAFADIFSNTAYMIIIDNQDMSMSVGLVGFQLGAIGVSFLQQEEFPFRPEGVRVKEYILDPNGDPLFAVGIENEKFAGVNFGVIPERIIL